MTSIALLEPLQSSDFFLQIDRGRVHCIQLGPDATSFKLSVPYFCKKQILTEHDIFISPMASVSWCKSAVLLDKLSALIVFFEDGPSVMLAGYGDLRKTIELICKPMEDVPDRGGIDISALLKCSFDITYWRKFLSAASRVFDKGEG